MTINQITVNAFGIDYLVRRRDFGKPVIWEKNGFFSWWSHSSSFTKSNARSRLFISPMRRKRRVATWWLWRYVDVRRKLSKRSQYPSCWVKYTCIYNNVNILFETKVRNMNQWLIWTDGKIDNESKMLAQAWYSWQDCSYFVFTYLV